jgi:Mn-containing catalase
MEKKGEIFNQLAIIADLLENINLESTSKSVIIELNEIEFEKMYKQIIKKIKAQTDMAETAFTVKIGYVDFVFALNKSNV